MRTPGRILFALLVSVLFNQVVDASQVRPRPLPEQILNADAICRGTVLEVTSFRDPVGNRIHTRTLVRVDESLKGTLPALLRLVQRGGAMEGESETDGLRPRLAVGEEFLFFLQRRPNATLFVRPGGAKLLPAHQALLDQVRAALAAAPQTGIDATDQGTAALMPAQVASPAGPATAQVAVKGLILDDDGLAARFTAPDRGARIPYVVDADALPAGVTLPQALAAVEQALAAWSAVTSLTFAFEEVRSFGQSAPDLNPKDGKLYLQLHDLYGSLPGGGVLGNGGRRSTEQPEVFNSVGWGSGGQVAGNEFHATTSGYIVLDHTAVELQNLSALAAAICHEIGHALSLAHSSELDPEPNPILRGSIMYYTISNDARGATLGSYDPPIIQQVYPPLNTPPYTFSRVMDITTASSALPNQAGLNQIELRGYDRQGGNLTIATAVATAQNGTFSRQGNVLKYSPSGFVGAPRFDPASRNFYEIIYFRFSDGLNASAVASARVLSYNPDTRPSGAVDGIPDNWMLQFFGNANPANGVKHKPGDDADGDGFTNWQEYLLGSSPIDPNSNLKITSVGLDQIQWQAKPYELYEVQTSTNLRDWTNAVYPVLPTTSTGRVTQFKKTEPALFFRVVKVP